MHPMYSYAYITDRYEGLIVVDVMNLADGDPRNNFLERAVTYNPANVLEGAQNLAIAGHYVYVATGEKGLEAIAVTETDEPQAVIGSYLQSLAFPDYFARHLANERELVEAYHHGGRNILSLQLRGEYLPP